MTDYQKYIIALRKCAKEHINDRTSFGHIIVSDLCIDTANLLKELEQEHCEDYISRQSVLDIAKSSKSNWIDNSVLFKRVNELQPIILPRWISVSERLPEFRKEVLTCSNGGFIEIQSLEDSDSYDGYWENQKGDWTNLEEITAWMPLPKPYEPQESEDKE